MSKDFKPVEPSTFENAPIYKMVLMCMIMSGLIFTESISNQLLPLTLRRFTEDAAVIGLIKSINPMFGFIAQPLVGVLSDRIWTPVGRRGFFMIISAPIVSVSLFFIPEMSVFMNLIIWIIILQFFQDILWGSDHPLLADLFPPRQRAFVAGLMAASGSLAGFIFLKFLMVHFSEMEIYRIVAGAQIVLVFFSAFFLGEKKIIHSQASIDAKNKAKRDLDESYGSMAPFAGAVKFIVDYIRDIFANSILTRFVFLNFGKMLFLSLVGGWISLFATETMGLTKEEFGNNWGYEPLLTLILAVPAGYFIGKYCPKQWTLVVGYSIALVGCVFGYMADSASDLIVVAILIGLGGVVDKVTRKPFFTEFLPKEKIGQLTGAFNIFLGLGRWFAELGGGFFIGLMGNDYRFMWIMAFFVGLLTLIVTATIPDVNYQQRKIDKMMKQMGEGGE